jgi:hypothetical protein
MSKKEKQYEMIATIAELAEELGWNIIIPKNEDDEETVVGLIMGTPEFMEEVHMAPENIEEIITFDSVKNKGSIH